ncbi:cytochrome b/b6 domain-containing protein [Phaeobacter inhibens]|uniref:cytochrome b/b6 domain-containing protein n=1 Tax=Phaeobacter inhibens TaxID=221822 RepID=UPI0021A7FA16|nr:cytochrome b/b6 domain-containing protein [Phaeobacter inhibens]UWR63028.1 cytochrome b/b6 domain-containing protein [Phaeobacter inhibens]
MSSPASSPAARHNTARHYGSVAKGFHWLTALLMLAVFPLGYFANDLAHHIQSADFDGAQATLTRAALLFSLHKTLGLALFLTALLRILWALSQPKPVPLHPERRAETVLAEVVHWLLYSALVAAPLTGWIHHAATTGFAPIWWPFGQDLPFVPKSEAVAAVFGGLHWLFVWTLAVALGLHIAGALKHEVIDRDATLRRMLPGRAPEVTAQAETPHGALPFLVALAIWGLVLAGGGAFGLYAPHSHAPADTAAGHGHDHDHEAGTDTDTMPTGGWVVQDGTLAIAIVQMGSEVRGQFDQWQASIAFEEPNAPGPAGTVTVSVAIPSLMLGSVTDQAMGPDYFDSSTYPTAEFRAEIEKLAEGYIAEGTLRIRDQEVPLRLPFTLDLNGDTATMSASAEVNRLDFNIGQGVQDEGSLAYAVTIAVDLTASRAP